MADAFLVSTRLRLFFEIGHDEEGEPILKSKLFNNVKKSATAEQLYETSAALASLSTYPLNTVERNDSYEIY